MTEGNDEHAAPHGAPPEGGVLLAEVMAIVKEALREQGLLREPDSEATTLRDQPRLQ